MSLIFNQMKKGSANNIFTRHKTPEAAISRIVAIVAHHEVMTFGDFADHISHVVETVIQTIVALNRASHGRHLVIFKDLVFDTIQVFIKLV